jgi:Large polyvalent protein-associated domain 7
LFEYNQYRNQQRAVCKGITAKGREDRQQTLTRLKRRKKEIRALAQPWPAKKILLSEAVAASVIELRTLKMSTLKTRQAQFPKNLRTWVADRAGEGDVRAAAQLRGWRYADQRTQRRLDAALETNALHLGPETDEEKSDWSEFMQQRLAVQQRAENLAGQIATARIWTINRTTGDVSYTLNGKLSVIDRGRRVTVLNQNEAAIVFGLEMAVQKYGSRIACSGGDDWKRQVVKVAVQNGIFVEFTDPEMRDGMYQHQLLANPLQIKAARLDALETRLQNEDTGELLFTNETDVQMLLSCLQPTAHSQQLIQILKVSQEPEPKAKVGGNLTVAVIKTPDGRQSFRVSIDEGKHKHVLERVERVRQSAHWALRDRIKTRSQEREGR